MANRKKGGPLLTEIARLEAMLGQGKVADVLKEAAMLAAAHPKSAPIQITLGVAHLRLGMFEPAERAFARAAQIEPRNATAWSNLGLSLKELGRSGDAVRALRRATRVNPSLAAAHYNLGNLLREIGSPGEAIEPYRKTIALDPGNALAHHNLGIAYSNLEDFGAAAQASGAAIRLNPAHAGAHANLGNALFGLGRLAESVQCYRKALELEPDNAQFHYNLGRVQRDLFEFDAARAAYRRAIALDEALVSAHLNLALLSLLVGDFETGWRESEWRKGRPNTQPDSHFTAKPWLGKESLNGESILLHAEQGLGDTIQFVRYADTVSKLGARITLAVQPGLMPLIRRSFPGVDVVSYAVPPPRTSLQTHLMSLPLAFATRLDSVPASAAYIAADPERVALWRERLGPRGFKVGICWQGSTEKVDKGRSFPLERFAEVSRIPGVRLISLHKGAGEAQLSQMAELDVEILGPDFDPPGNAFEDTAAVMMHCDLVITSDTAIAHLAGALGRPVWVILKRLPDWRWLMDRDDSPWYPSMRLFRQTESGHWQGPFANVAAELARLLAAKQPPHPVSPEQI